MKTVALLLVLTLVGVLGAGKLNKQGRCPQLIDYIPGMKCPNPCKSDSECSGTEKCCLSDCGDNECMEPQKETPETMCGIACPRILLPVCGTDGMTYGNWCMLNFTTCTRNQPFIKKAYDGDCKTPEEKCQTNGVGGPCAVELMKSEQEALIGSMRPQCNDRGFYLPKQCHPSTGYCWCADCMGKKLTDPAREPITEDHCQQLINA